MVEAGVPVIPGSKEPVYTVEEGEKIAGEIGYPIIVKAALGGGGKRNACRTDTGRVPGKFPDSNRKKAQMAFGDGTMYLEHFVEHPRHIEFQILADKYGNVVHLGERDCSIQRNHQKDDRGISIRSTDTGIETEDGRSGCESGEGSSLYECRND